MPSITGARRQPGAPDAGVRDADSEKPNVQSTGVNNPDAASRNVRGKTNNPAQGYVKADRSSTAQASALGTDQRDRIERRAYELYEQRGCQPGHEVEDWLRAEQEVLGKA
jgi:hypothetical protein